jgi:hypothetical protein
LTIGHWCRQEFVCGRTLCWVGVALLMVMAARLQQSHWFQNTHCWLLEQAVEQPRAQPAKNSPPRPQE